MHEWTPTVTSLNIWAKKSSQGKLLSVVWAGTNCQQMQIFVRLTSLVHNESIIVWTSTYRNYYQKLWSHLNQCRKPKHKQNGNAAKISYETDIHSLHHIHTHTYICTHPHACTHSCAHTRAHTHTLTNTHMQTGSFSLSLRSCQEWGLFQRQFSSLQGNATVLNSGGLYIQS